MSKRNTISTMIPALAIAAAVSPAMAIPIGWVGGSGNWDAATTANWSPAQIPGSGDDVTFNATTTAVTQTVTVVGAQAANSLAFTQLGSTTLAGSGSISLGTGGLSVAGSSPTVNIGAVSFLLAGSQTWSNTSTLASAATLFLNSGSAAPAASVATPTTLTITGSKLTNVKGTNFLRDGAAATLGLIVDVTSNTNLYTVNTSQSYSGGTLIRSGIVRSENGGGFGTGVVTLGDSSGSAVTQITLLGTQSIGNALTVQAGSSGASSLTTVNTASSGTFSNTVTLGKTLSVAPTGSIVFNGRVTGDAVLAKSAAGVLTLSNATNDFTGGTTLGGGTLRLGASNVLGNGAVTFIASSTISSTDNTARAISNALGTFAGSSATYTFGTATESGALNFTNAATASLAASAATRTFAVNADTTFANGFSGVGATALIKTGTAAVTFNGANTYTGATTVRAGAVIANSAIGPVVVGDTAAAATAATFGGIGSAGAVSVVTAAGRINPALVGTIGNLSVASLTMTANGTLAFDVSGAANDRIDSSGAVALGSADLGLSLTAASPAAIFFLINNLGASAVTGSFTTLNGAAVPAGESLAEGGQFTVGGQAYNITYAADFATSSFTGGNDVAITAVPEPTTLAAASLALGLLLRRRR